MPWPTGEELDDLVARFQERTLPKPEWTHRAHLAVGTWHVWHYGLDAARGRLRSGIRLLNDAHGTPNTDESGYHETVTRAYLYLIDRFLREFRERTTAAECARAVLESPIAQKGALLSYYSQARLMSVGARRDWMEPDRRPLTPD